MKTLPKIWEHINNYTDKRSMMRAVSEVWPKNSPEYERIERAYNDSFEGHRKQWRHSGERYFRHILGVVVIIFLYLRIHDANLIVAAFLHDLTEDHPQDWSIQKVRNIYGYDVSILVKSVSKPEIKPIPGLRFVTDSLIFTKVWTGGRRAVTLKLADRLHNMITLWGTPKQKYNKISETKFYVLPMAYTIDVLYRELQEAIDAQEKSVHIKDSEDSVVGSKLL